MKKIVLSLLFLAFSGFALQAQVSASSLKVEVKNGEVFINKVSLSKTWSLKNMINLLGNQARERSGHNRTYSYDDYGFVLFEPSPNKEPSGNISEFQTYFSEPASPSEVAPRGYFKGSFIIDGVTITKSSDINSLRVDLNQYSESNSYLDHSYRLAYKGLYFYLQFNDSETRLIKVSIGKDTRKNED